MLRVIWKRDARNDLSDSDFATSLGFTQRMKPPAHLTWPRRLPA